MIRRYPAYKDTGVGWLGNLPAGWDLKRLRFAATLNPSKSELAEFDRNEEVSFIPMEAVGENGELDTSRTRPIAEVETGYTYLRNGDMTFAKITPCFENGKRAIMRDLIGGIGFGTTELTVLRPRVGQTTTEYLFWLLSSPSFRKTGEAFMYGAGGQKRVPDDFVRDFAIALPPLPEQTAIAAFLDQETAKIDTLVAEQRRLIELLREKRQAVISRAVTKGLNPDASMKPSGIEWLGDVPEHWRLPKLKSVAAFSGGGTPSRDDPTYWNGDIPWVSPKDMKAERIQGAEESITEEGLRNSASNLLPPGRILIVVRSGILKHTIPIAINETAVALNQDMKALSFNANKCDARFFLRWVQGYNAQLLFAWAKQGATVESIEHNYLAQTVIPMPDVPEQVAIIEFLKAELSKFDNLTAEAQRAIDLLQERRTALISAAVTGQIDVRPQIRN